MSTIFEQGKIHSYESFGTLDGPGIRFVIFFAGCPLRCQYCHNIDVVYCQEAQHKPEMVMQAILREAPYFECSGGGVTISGGDPFFQPLFLESFLSRCHAEKIHTAVDTSLFTSKECIDRVLRHTDLFMISLKHFDNEIHKFLTGFPNKIILNNIRYLSEKKSRIWFRYLVLPGYTDTEKNLTALEDFLKTINFELVELLAYHEMGVYKWKELNLEYELKNQPAPTADSMQKIKKRLEKKGIKVLFNE